ncbi:MAG TPA: hypothetical protein VF006_09570 [Longimicrobium sp.]
MTTIDSTIDTTAEATAMAEHAAAGTPGTLPEGLEVGAASGPRTDLNGLRMQKPGAGEIYLIDRGYKRHIPNPTTYNNLFANWDGIIQYVNLDDIPSGPGITNGALLMQGGGYEQFLCDDRCKRHIASQDTFRRYNFNAGAIYQFPAIVVDFVPTGERIG